MFVRNLSTARTACVALLLAGSFVLGSLPIQAYAGSKLRLRSGDVDLLTVTAGDKLSETFALGRFDSEYEDDVFGEASSGSKDEVKQARRLAMTWVGTKEKRPRKKADPKAVRHFVVQMRDRISAEDVKNLDSLKLEVVRYLPEDAIVIASTTRKLQVLSRSSPRIRAISLYRPEWKLAPELGASSVFSGDPIVRTELLVFPDHDARTLEANLRRAKLKIVSLAKDKVVVESRRSSIQTLASIEAVEWIAPIDEAGEEIIADATTPAIEPATLERIPSLSRTWEWLSASILPTAKADGIDMREGDLWATEARRYLENERGIPSPSKSMVQAALIERGPSGFKSLTSAILVDERTGLGPGESHVYPVTLTKSTEVSVTLVYPDADRAPAAVLPTVNDLDITVIAANGKRIEVGKSSDLVDKMSGLERLTASLPSGAYRIEVRGVNVPMAKQAYALVVSAH